MSQELPPQKVGRYEVEREIERGAMGIVYLARDPAIGRRVAVKMLRRSLLEDGSEGPGFKERFLREAQAAGSLAHANIVTIHDVGEDPHTGTPFIAMEFVEGKNLRTLLAEGRRFSFGEIAAMVARLSDALDYAHRKGVIHRDVKPANILITPEGVPKIADFGVARIENSSVTTGRQMLGTPKYMSPEQVTGAPVDGRSDLFSLGMVLYELLTGRSPFMGANLSEISGNIAHESFLPPSQIGHGIPGEFDAVLSRAMAKEPRNRYQRGQQLTNDLKRIAARLKVSRPAPAGRSVAEDAVLDTRPLRLSRPRPPRPRLRLAQWLLVILIGGLFLGIVVISAFPAYFLATGRNSPAPKPAPVVLQLPQLPRQAQSQPAPSPPPSASISRSTNALPEVLAGHRATGMTRLTVLFSSALSSGSLEVRMDGRRILDRRFAHGKSVKEHLAISPGHRRLNVHIRGAGGFEASRVVEADFHAGERRTLHIDLFKGDVLAAVD